ncbi:protein PIGBOS1 [Xyrauchen texanus]|uniref:protein PIGBOS1 n=1 Tax=Xyrauchen texanus TaxID=154827 RepID=UPI0022425557|nr:protein PIGBOS1 [Xyrauchen texanus]XP_051952654.1 protein PIGBOS1 [Xyrauchen texanus]
MFRRRIPFHQIAFATLVGVVGGMYVYRPFFELPRKPPSAPNEDLKPDPEEQRGAETTQQDHTATEDASATKH